MPEMYAVGDCVPANRKLTLSTDAKFTKGEQLIVKPADGDDPEAMNRAGQVCTFVRYVDAPGKLSAFAIVQFANAPKPLYMRQCDLVGKENA